MKETFEEWKAKIDAKVAAYDELIALLTVLRDSVAMASYPAGLKARGIKDDGTRL
jgi:hypothetical protein